MQVQRKNAGWIKELRVQSDGLWGRVEWTAQASQLIGQKAYGYLGPSFFHRKTDNAIVRLKGAGLGHNPNLHLHALAHQRMEHTTLLARPLEALNLPETVDEDDVFEQLSKRGRMLTEQETAGQMTGTPDPARYVPIEVVKDLRNSLGQSTAVQAQDRAERKVKTALAKGYISPAMRSWALALYTQDEAGFDAFVRGHPPALGHLMQPSGLNSLPPSQSTEVETGLAASVCAQLG